ncbi:protein FAM122A-like [Pollicipes pollicipes]|uniref:protein FAM122A-like n=1 Tax=Pollicipes pollicipes TaxID=41117 RepID=UPI0018858F33|nr:protein FAM122A-like [Pollicipes pollicipes]
MINELVSQAQSTSSASSRGLGSPPLVFSAGSGSTHNPRVRRFSANFSPLAAPSSPGSSSGVRTPSRLMQIRQEAGLEDPEIRHERSVHAALQMSLSCEDLALSTREDPKKAAPVRSVTDPLHLTMPQPQPFSFGSSPSPTRPAGTPYFSPQIPERLRGPTFSPSPSPMSPILRPSPLGGAVKRKFDYDKERPPVIGHNKRFHSGGGLLAPHPPVYSSTASDAALGALQGSVGSVGTPESLSSVGSPGLSYKQDDSPRPMVAETMDSSSVFRPVESPRSSERRLKADHDKMDDACVPMETGGGDKMVVLDVARPVAMETGGGSGDGKVPMDTGGQRLPGHAQYMRQSI